MVVGDIYRVVVRGCRLTWLILLEVFLAVMIFLDGNSFLHERFGVTTFV